MTIAAGCRSDTSRLCLNPPPIPRIDFFGV